MQKSELIKTHNIIFNLHQSCQQHPNHRKLGKEQGRNQPPASHVTPRSVNESGIFRPAQLPSLQATAKMSLTISNRKGVKARARKIVPTRGDPRNR
jgi:hypothetical protein